MLNQKYSEAPSAVGVQANGHLVEVFASNDGTSWTIVVTRPDGVSCIVAVGENWETVPNPVTQPLALTATSHLPLWPRLPVAGGADLCSSCTNGLK